MTRPNDPIQAYLASLPEPALPDTVWPRLKRRQKDRRRWFGPVWLLAAACAGAFAVMLAVRTPPTMIPSSADRDQAAALAPSANILVQVRAIDRALQIAYARGADAAETRDLWQIREALLAQSSGPPPRPTRI